MNNEPHETLEVDSMNNEPHKTHDQPGHTTDPTRIQVFKKEWGNDSANHMKMVLDVNLTSDITKSDTAKFGYKVVNWFQTGIFIIRPRYMCRLSFARLFELGIQVLCLFRPPYNLHHILTG